MYRMDHAYKRHRHWLRGRELEKMPSEYFREHVYFTFQDDHTAVPAQGPHERRAHDVGERLPPQRLRRGPGRSTCSAKQAASLTAAEKDLVLHDNVARLYRLDTSDLPAAA